MLFRQLFEPESSTYTYLLADTETKDAVLIDPVRETFERDVELLEDLGLRLRYVLETHVHADHVTSAALLKQRYGAKTVVSKAGGVKDVDIAAEDGDVIHFGKYALEVRSTPGHTNGCVTYVTADMKRAFTGDALLIRGSGRTDFQQGDARTLYRSVHDQIFSLPDETELFPGHDYKGRTVTTVGEERALNPRLGGGKSENDFVAIMENLKLANPKKIDLAVPANLRGGLLDGEVLVAANDNKQWADYERSATGVPEVTPAWVNAHAAEVTLVDVRGVEEFTDDLGHIAGAVNVPLHTLEEAAAEWDRNTRIVTICRSGGRSGRGALILEGMGFHHVVSMKQGMLRWDAEGFCSINKSAGDMKTLEGVREEIFGCFVGMAGRAPEELRPEFRGVFKMVGANYEHPDRAGLEKVLLALKNNAVANGMQLEDIEPHLNQFQAAIRGAVPKAA